MSKALVKKRYGKNGYEVFYCGCCRKQLLKIKNYIMMNYYKGR